MCGFVGILTRPERPVDAEILGAMAHTIRHRGPDGEGQQIDDRVGLHHKRLAIIDLATGQQPMTSGPFTIVFNGEIYNYVELREDLRRRGHEFRTQSDTEVILRLYAEHGEGCVKLLNGMFAFLLYDRERGVVLAARDHFGIKPLYYAEIGGQLCYASEIKALLRHPEALRAPNTDGAARLPDLPVRAGRRDPVPRGPQAPAGSLPGGGPGDARGPHREVLGADLPARPISHRGVFRRGSAPPAERRGAPADAQRRAGGLLPERRHGLEPGDAACGAARRRQAAHLLRRFKEGPEFNELDYAREVARTCGAESHEIFPTEQEFVRPAARRWSTTWTSRWRGRACSRSTSCRAWPQKQVKVCLGGQGGDEIFGGYTRYLVAYFEQALKGAIFETNEEQEHIVSLRSIVPNLAALKQYVPMLKQFWSDELFQPMDRRYFRLIDRSGGALGPPERRLPRRLPPRGAVRALPAVSSTTRTRRPTTTR